MIYWLRQRKTLLISQLSDSLQYGLYWQKREGLLAELLKVGGGGQEDPLHTLTVHWTFSFYWFLDLPG